MPWLHGPACSCPHRNYITSASITLFFFFFQFFMEYFSIFLSVLILHRIVHYHDAYTYNPKDDPRITCSVSPTTPSKQTIMTAQPISPNGRSPTTSSHHGLRSPCLQRQILLRRRQLLRRNLRPQSPPPRDRP